MLSKKLVKRSARKKKCPYENYEFYETKTSITHYKLLGKRDGHLVICLHGLNGNLSTFDNLSYNLSKFGYYILTYDLLGHGLSIAPTFDVFRRKNYFVDFFVDQLEKLLIYLHLLDRKFSLIGFSLGTIIVARFAEKFIDKIENVVLISPTGMLSKKPKIVRTLKLLPCLIPCIAKCFHKCCVTGLISKNNEKFDESLRNEANSNVASNADINDTSKISDDKSKFILTYDTDKPTSQDLQNLPNVEFDAFLKTNYSSNALPKTEGLIEKKSTATLSANKKYNISMLIKENDKFTIELKELIKQKRNRENRIKERKIIWNRIEWSLFDKKGTVDAFLGCITRMPIWNSEKNYTKLAEARIPTLILWGKDDVTSPPSAADKLLNIFTNKHVIFLKNTGHSVMTEKSAKCNAVIITFLQFPHDADLRIFRHLLPINDHGEYVEPQHRKPSNVDETTCKQFLNFKLHHTVVLDIENM